MEEITNANETASDTYVVAQGDTLWTIAQKVDLTVNQLKTLNNLVGDTIYVGQHLVVRNQEPSAPSEILPETPLDPQTAATEQVEQSSPETETPADNQEANQVAEDAKSEENVVTAEPQIKSTTLFIDGEEFPVQEIDGRPFVDLVSVADKFGYRHLKDPRNGEYVAVKNSFFEKN